MTLRILLTLLILTYTPCIHSTPICTKINRDTVRCDSFLAFNGTSKSIIIDKCDDLHLIDNSLEIASWHSVTNVTFDCALNKFPWGFADVFPNIQYIQFSKCNLTTLSWQSVYTETLKTVDLTQCPIECNCKNQWMKADGNFEHLKEPLSLRKCLPDCDPGRIRINSSVIIRNKGDNVTIHLDVHGEYLNKTIDKPYFEWAYAKTRHEHDERVSLTSLDLVITNLTRDDMGLIGVTCWHCVDYLTAQVELRMNNTPVKVEFVEKTRGDTDFLVAQGYPIENVTLAITRNNYTERQIVTPEKDAIYFQSLVVRLEKHKTFYQRTYRIFTKDTAEGDHLSGDLKFEVCTLQSCDSVEKHVSHLGVINGTMEEIIVSEFTYRNEIQIGIIIVFLVLLLIAAVLGVHFKKKIQSYIGGKIISFRKRIALQEIPLRRRSSQETEETLLRLEERSSLASDYSNTTLPFIDLGDIQIHDIMGRGHFGEVYLGTWEPMGPNSVAVKTIRRADAETEKEARLLKELDHPNIVKLYGMTVANLNLLLVFENMNFGDLKSYVQKRAPSKSHYLQYPPPLVNDELKWIIKEIATGLVYLVSKSIVHRDIAARNILVSGDSDMKACSHLQRPPITVKISDFGMSRQLYDSSDYYTMDHHGALPIRWLSPEAVQHHKFTHMSDIWAFGVTMWECMTYGEQPFSGLSNFEVSSITMSDILNCRPPKPPRCPQDLYDLMCKCWNNNAALRITAKQIVEDPLFDKVRNGLPYQAPVEHNSVVAAYLSNTSRYEDEIAETSFTEVDLNGGTMNFDFLLNAEKSDSESDSGAVAFRGATTFGEIPEQSDELPIFSSA